MGCTKWMELQKKNISQSNILLIGIVILLTTNMYYVSTMYDAEYKREKWTYNLSSTAILMTLILFHIAAMFGSLAAWILVGRFTKKRINYVIISVVVAGCTVGNAAPNNLIGVAFARGLIGLAQGMVSLVVLIHASEIAVKELRGFIMAQINFGVFCGMFIGEAVQPFGLEEFSINIVLGFIWPLTFLLNHFVCHESPVFLLRRYKDAEAFRNMIKLRNATTETEIREIHNEFNDLKTMLSEDVSTKQSIFSDGNLRPLILVALGKIASVLSFNYAINTVKANAIVQLLQENGSYMRLSIATLMLIRMIVGIGAMFVVDVFGRRTLQLVSTISTGLILVAVGSIYLARNSIESNIGVMLFVVCEVVSSLGLTIIPDVLCTEAFNTKKKALSIVTVQILEQLLHLIIFTIVYKWEAVVQNWYGETLLAAGIPLLVIGLVFYRELPETSKMSLRQSRMVFYMQEESLPTFRYQKLVYCGNKNSVQVVIE